MATIIRIKRSSTTNAPSSLKTGELAYSYGVGTQANGGDRFYLVKETTVQELPPVLLPLVVNILLIFLITFTAP